MKHKRLKLSGLLLLGLGMTGLQAQTSVTDYDGNVYNTVTIGTQVWMKENLRTTHYANGTAIPLVTGSINWMNVAITSKAYCWYNDDIANKTVYGALYTWTAAMNGSASTINNPSGIQGVCPTGWHLPSEPEWAQMENFLADNGYNYDGTTGGGRDKIAKALASSSGWISSSNTGAVGNNDFTLYRNKSNFTALPGGLRSQDGAFFSIEKNGSWWLSSESSSTLAKYRYIYYSYTRVVIDDYDKDFGFSVRCVKDQTTTDTDDFSNFQNQAFRVYPNPITDYLIVDLTNVNYEGEIFILTLEGKVLHAESTAEKGLVKIELASLPCGIYLCRFLNRNGVITKKIIKQ